jgi:Uma2 family endonuclease
MHDLPDEEVGQPGMPDIFHIWQPRLLDETFHPPGYEPEEIFTASDLNLYYNVRDFSQNKCPDWFAVVGLPKGQKSELRWSYVMWQEGVAPLIVVELLSPGTAKEDLGQRLHEAGSTHSKWEVYERWLRVPYYVTFDRYKDELRIFRVGRRRLSGGGESSGQVLDRKTRTRAGLVARQLLQRRPALAALV